MNIRLTNDQVDEIILRGLLGTVDYIEGETLKNAIHTVIAYYSVPGTYADGVYDHVED